MSRYFLNFDVQKKTFEFLNYIVKSKIHNKDACFYCFEGLDDLFIHFIKNNFSWCKDTINSSYDEYHLIILEANGMAYKFSEAVKARNQNDNKSVVIFSNGTVKMVDSLKDFVQLDIFSLDFEKEIAGALKEVFGLDNSINWILKDKMSQHLSNIFYVVKPKPQQFINYIVKVGKDYTNINYDEDKRYFVLNSNLNILELWMSFSTNFIPKPKIKKMLSCSRIDIIKRKLEDINKINNLKKPDFKKNGIESDERIIEIVTGLTSNNINSTEIKNKLKRYTGNDRNILKEVYFEFVEELFKGSLRKNRIEKETECENFDNIYMIFINFLINNRQDISKYEYIDIEGTRIFENGLLDLNKYLLTLQLKKFTPSEEKFKELYKQDEIDVNITYAFTENKSEEIRYQKTFNLETDNKEYKLFKMDFLINQDVILIDRGNSVKFDKLIEIIEDRRVNLNDKKSEILQLLIKLKEARSKIFEEDFLYFPKLFLGWERILNYIESYFDLLKALYGLGNWLLHTSLAENRFIDYLINIDSVITSDSIRISCFNPVMLFRSLVMNKIYRDFIKNFKHEPLGIKVAALKKVTDKFPIEKLVWEGKPYFFREQPVNVYYKEAFLGDKAESFENIDTYRLSEKINSYITMHRYKSELKIGFAGYLNIPVLKQNISRLLATNKSCTNFKKVLINISCMFKEKTKDEIIFNTEHDEVFKDSIGFSIKDWPEDNITEFIEEYIKSNDIVFLLDPSFIYDPLACQDERDSGILMFMAENRELEKEIKINSDYVREDTNGVPVIPGIINNLNIYSYTNSIYNGYWKKYVIKPSIINSITSSLDTYGSGDKIIYLYTGNSTPEDFIDRYENIEELQKDINGLNEISIIKFAKNDGVREIIKSDSCKNDYTIEFSLLEYVRKIQMDFDKVEINESFIEGYEDESIQEICKRIGIRLDYSNITDNIIINVSFDDNDYYQKIDSKNNLALINDESDIDKPSRKSVVTYVIPYMQSIFFPNTQDDWYCKKVFEKVLLECSTDINDLIFTHIYSNKFNKIRECKKINIRLVDNITHINSKKLDYKKYSLLKLIKMLDRESLSGRDIDDILSMYKNDKSKLSKDISMIKEVINYVYADSNLSKNIDRGLFV